MSKENSSQFKKKFFSLLKFLLLIVVCVAASIILVWPLWKISTNSPKVYTIIVFVLLGGAFVFWLINKIRKTKWQTTVRFLVNLLLICGGLFFSVRFVLFEKKLLALGILIGALLLLILCNFLFSRFQHE